MRTLQTAFSPMFRAYLLSGLMTDYNLLTGYRQLVKPVYFEDPMERMIVRVLLAYWDDNEELPNFASWQEFCQVYMAKRADKVDALDIEALGGPVGTLRILLKGGATLMREPCYVNRYLTRRLIEFAKENESLLALQKFIDKKKRDELEPAECVAEFERIAALGQDHSDVGEEFWANAAKVGEDKPKFIPLGVGGLDAALKGGVVRGEMLGLVAPPKGFKTGTLLNFTKFLSMGGYHVAYASGEESNGRLKAKLRASITGIEPEAQFKDPVYAAKMINAASAAFKGKIFIKKFPTRNFTAKGIEAWIRALKHKVDVIVVDFLDLMISDKDKSGQDHLERVSVCEELRDLGSIFNAAILTANKGNKDTIDKVLVGAEGIGLAFGKGYVFDNMVGLGLTEEQRKEGELSMYLFYNRYGPANMILGCKVDLACTQLAYSPEVTEKVKQALSKKAANTKGFEMPIFMTEDISDAFATSKKGVSKKKIIV